MNRKIISIVSSFILALSCLMSIKFVYEPYKADASTTSLIDGAVYTIRNQKSSLYFDIESANYDNYSKLLQYHNTNKANQQFRIKKVSGYNDVYNIIPLIAPDKRVDVSNGSQENDTQIIIYSANNTIAQNFKIIDDGNGTGSFKILTGTTNFTKAIVSKNASMNPTELIQYTYSNNGTSDNDHWYFERVTTSNEYVAKLRIHAFNSTSLDVVSNLNNNTLPRNLFQQKEEHINPIQNYVNTFNVETNSTRDSSGSLSGHAYLSITNICNSNITVGIVTLEPGNTLSVGTFPNSNDYNTSADRGIWFNREALFYPTSTHNGTYTLADYLTTEKLNELTAHINYESNDDWTLLNNCSNFAVRGWNLVSNQTLTAGLICTPTNLIESMLTYSSFKFGDAFGQYNSSLCGYMYLNNFYSIVY